MTQIACESVLASIQRGALCTTRLSLLSTGCYCGESGVRRGQFSPLRMCHDVGASGTVLFLSNRTRKNTTSDEINQTPPDTIVSNMSSPKTVRWGILATGGIAVTLYVPRNAPP
jgi:hypothetical protein